MQIKNGSVRPDRWNRFWTWPGDQIRQTSEF